MGLLPLSLCGMFAPALQATADNAEFLPDHYESIRAATIQTEAFPEQQAPGAILVFDRTDEKPLSGSDRAGPTWTTSTDRAHPTPFRPSCHRHRDSTERPEDGMISPLSWVSANRMQRRSALTPWTP